MKKLLILSIIFSLFVITAMVYAADFDKPDGIVWTTSTADNNITDTSIKHYPYSADQSGKDLAAQVKLVAKAYIPCYLKMEFTGNTGKIIIEGISPNAQGNVTPNEYQMVFDNEIGGFVDGGWNGLGVGTNAVVAPASNVYIAAGDTFKVKVYSNDNFKYDVIGSPLTNNAGAVLYLEMGVSDSPGGTYSNTTFKAANETVNIATGAPCATIEKYHRFRVPYTTTTMHGEYSGDIIFKAYTI
jgi:hypothetical protein